MIWARAVLVGLVLASTCMAQQSSSFRLTEYTFNSGGHPADGVVMSSNSFRVTLDTVGESIAAVQLGSTNLVLDASFATAYAPAAEVGELRFTDHVTLAWNPEATGGEFNLYRDLLGNLSGATYGNCLRPDIAGETTFDTGQPPPGQGYFYLVTANNRIEEEGTKGTDSSGAVRPNPNPCP